MSNNIRLPRVWDKVEKEMMLPARWEEDVVGCSHKKIGLYIYRSTKDPRQHSSLDWVLKHPGYFKVMWPTGLKDKNGKDLGWWEGDIFKRHGQSLPWVIVKEQGCFWFKCPVMKERQLCYRVAEYVNQPIKIGDIHSTPELLETKNVT